NKVDELDMWEQAKTISRDMLDGKIWLTEVGHATHYHAYWVHPSWVHEMKKMYRLGVHTFCRPRAWSDVPEGPVWASVPVPVKSTGPSAQNPDAKEPDAASKSPEAAAKIPQAAASPPPEGQASDRAALTSRGAQGSHALISRRERFSWVRPGETLFSRLREAFC